MTSISAIRVERRFRKNPGDIAGLAKSIAELGLLQPVVITPDRTLIAGARRLFACKSLGWTDVPTREVDLAELVRAEHDENECRKDFTASERVAIVTALRTRDKAGRPNSSDRNNLTTDEAAKRAGFESRNEFFRAQKVVDKGDPELVAAMDAGAMSAERAAEVAELPPEEQRKVAALPTPAQARAVAREQGGYVKANDGRLYDGRSAAELKGEKERTAVIFQFVEAVERLATMPESPGEYLAALPATMREPIDRSLVKAESWLGEFGRLWRSENHD